MSASLVGSEMCIRDSSSRPLSMDGTSWHGPGLPRRPNRSARERRARAVSYTHLTLPTICSV
eukprot:3449091-Alexandrium_andersonii.AAC.1